MTGEKERWQRLSQLFDRALDLEGPQRDAFVDSECADDPGLGAQLRRMLAADALQSGLDAGVAGVMSLPHIEGDEDDDADDAAIGERLGPWRLETLLGRGGMGSVYAARRDDGSAGQRAAIKRLRQRWERSALAERFVQERRILAKLSHANIPALLDYGLDAGGRPWFALEYVDGQTLVEWADARRTGLRERIALFLQVCAAVQHAHERFVVHRDLKPDNILIDRSGRARVLDFGVAKRLDADERATRTDMCAGFTPEYAAPEQVSGGAITAATDVYALGVLLYQLLAGQLPYHFAKADLRGATEAIAAHAAERLERALVAGDPIQVGERIACRDTTPAAFRRFVRGDLTRIVQTALAKEPERRYASVEAMASDLRRFLDGRPVSVSGDTYGYRMGKFVRRNRWGVAMATLATLALLVGSAFSLYRAEQERVQRERSEAVLAFMKNLFFGDAEEGGYGTQLTAVQLLDRAAGRVDSAFPDDPIGKAELLGVIASVYGTLDLHRESSLYAQRAVTLSRGLRERLPKQYVEHVGLLADAYSESGRYRELVGLINAELAFARRHDDRDMLSASLLRQRGHAFRELGRLKDAERDLRAAIAAYESARTPASSRIGKAYNDLALLVSDSGDSEQAHGLFRRVESIHRHAPDVLTPDRLINRFNQARETYRLGRVDDTIALLEPAIARMEAISGPSYSRTSVARNLLAQAYAGVGRYGDALAMVERNLQAQRSSRVADAEAIAQTEMVRAKLLTYLGRAEQALPIAEAGVRLLRERYPQPTALRGRSQWILGESLLSLRRCGQAEPLLRAALADERAQTGGKPSVNAGEALDSLGRCRVQARDWAGAIALLDQAVAAFQTELGADHPRTLRSRLHRDWVRSLRGADPDGLARMAADRAALATAMRGEQTPVLWQADLLIDDAARAQGRPGPDAARIARARAGLSAGAGPVRAMPPLGINSFS